MTTYDNPPIYAEFSDPRLVAIYDTVCPLDGYEVFYLKLAAELNAEFILDIGCGSGLLTHELSKQGHRMIGLEPSPAMLALAQAREYPNPVQWIAGPASQLSALQADLAIMTGHVAQFFLDDAGWDQALKAIHGALRPGGHLAFESRNPLIHPWAEDGTTQAVAWPTRTTRRTVHDPAVGPVDWWVQPQGFSNRLLHYALHYVFAESGDELISEAALKFRTQAELEQSLSRAGFKVEQVYGDWDRQPVSAEAPEMIFVALR